MKIRIWGSRGSLPSPLKPKQVEEKICQAILGLADIDTSDLEKVRAYVRTLPPLLRGTAGGNTACVEVQAGGETLIIDAGSGLRELGLELMKGPCGRGQGRVHILISHPHWDHIQGFPMFRPAFIPGNQLLIYSVHDVRRALEDQQRPLNWPVDLSYMQAQKEFVSLQPGQPLSIGRVRVDTIQNNHPGDSYSYRFRDQHCTLVYASDAEYKQLDEASLQPYLDFFRDADLLIFDTQYPLREAWQKVDWGHSSALIGVDMARAARVKKLLLFHHDPTCSDVELEEIRLRAIAYQAQDTSRPICEVLVAYEDLTLDLSPLGAADLQLLPDGEAAILTPSHTFDEYGVAQLARQLGRMAERKPSSVIDLSHVETLTTASLKSLVALHWEKAAPIVLAAPSDSIRQVIHLSGYLDYFALYPSVEAALAAVQACQALNLPGQVIQGRYQIEDKLGEGPWGTVLKATDIQTNRPVLLKILSVSLSQKVIDRFMRQAEQMIALDNPNVVRVFSYDQEDDYTFMVEEWVAGQSLQQLLEESDAPLPADLALSVARDIARALEYAHSRGVIHGDLKPANVILTEERARLSGFGLGRLEEGHNLLDAPWRFLSTSYLAPEQILGQPLDARTDLYALGVILYRLLTGQLPFEGADPDSIPMLLQQGPRPPHELNPQISPSLEHLILKLLARNPNERYASAQQVRRISGSLIAGTEELPGQRKVTLVGREKQLQALQACWEKAQAGPGQIVLITGESGIGKTSLAQEAVVRSEAPVQLMGRCREREGGAAYHLFTQVLRAYFATVPPEFLDHTAGHLCASFTRLVPEIRQMLPDLPELPPLEPEQEQLRLMASLAQFIRQATQERPWFLILDDLQWADPSSLELLRYLGRQLPSMRLLIVGTYRDVELEKGHPLRETLRDLGRLSIYHSLPLDRLDQVEVEQILVNLWQQPVPADLTHRIYRHTEGNPFYVEEVVKGLVDDGLIIWQEGSWHFPVLEGLRLPPSVREAVWGRIGHLSPDTLVLLNQAAVLGQTFKFGDLQEMSGLSEWQVLEHLDVALERQLIQEVAGDRGLRFRHAEIQHVLYADLGPLRRRVLHRQAGEALERRAMPEPERIAEDLAHHFREAGEFERALVYSMPAARQAQAAYANEAALLWYDRALTMLNQLDPVGATSFQSLRLSAHQSLGEVLTLVGQYEEALEHYASARALVEAESPSPDQARRWANLCRLTAEVYMRRSEYDQTLAWLEKGLHHLDKDEGTAELAHIYILSGRVRLHRGNYGPAQTWFERGLALARAASLRRVEADGLRYLGTVCYYQGDYATARNCLERARHIYREIGDQAGEGGTLKSIGAISDEQGDYDGARAYYEQALLIYREVGDRQMEGMILNNLGAALDEQGDYVQARANFEQALQIFGQIGSRWGQGITFGNLGNIALDHGDYVAARDYYEQTLRISQEVGDRHVEGTVFNNLSLIAHHQDDHETAQVYSQRALSIAREIGDPSLQGYALTSLGRALASMERLAEAADVYRQALGIRRQLGQPSLVMETLAGLARVSLAQGDLSQAQSQVEEMLGLSGSRSLEMSALDGAEEPFRVYLTCYRVLQANQDPLAQEVLSTAHSLLQERAAKISDEEMRHSFLENVATHREISEEFARGE